VTRSFTLSVAAAALACACGTPPTEHFYTLIGDAPALVSSGSGPSVNIASISLPEAVDRNEMVLHKGPNSVALMETRRWAESLKSAIPRVVANDLAPLIDSAAVSTADDNIGQNAKYLVRLDITRFDTSLGGTEAIDVAWVIHPASGAPDAKGKAALRVPARGGDFDDAVAAHSQALAQLSGEIAKQIKGLEKGGN
jgi:uncharacterized lipoprotein YmbA